MLHLLKEHILTSTGTVRKNKREIPKQMLQIRNRDVHSSLFGFQKDISLVSYMQKKNKVVLVMSTLHHDNKIDSTTLEKMKREMITFYNQTKRGVDVVDELCSNYNIARNTKRWPMVILYAAMNLAAINSIIIYKANNNCSLPRRDFLRDLGLGLISEHLQNRKNNQYLPKELRKRIQDHLGESSKEPPNKVARSIRRCEICPTKKDRKTKYVCYKCNCYICMEHAFFTCENCTRSQHE
ncbi:unnamed protein product [Euphydryas editha]|uniref:PiggyBac transposable element-derived protein domain-containing protein n=2 Tax=Euphydryas editha TaxID=104508 RepID=A0AAU9UNQ7_EUPED|nr:unnamed protein product [Euphydryas editha]